MDEKSPFRVLLKHMSKEDAIEAAEEIIKNLIVAVEVDRGCAIEAFCNCATREKPKVVVIDKDEPGMELPDEEVAYYLEVMPSAGCRWSHCLERI